MRPSSVVRIVQGGSDEEENEDWEVVNGIVTDVYNTLRRRDFSDDDIYFLSPAKNPDETVDAETSQGNLERLI